MKFILAVIAVIVGLMIYNAGEALYAEYRHQEAVEHCKKEARGPEWAEGMTSWACEQWAK